MKIFNKKTSHLFLLFFFMVLVAIALFYQGSIYRTDILSSQGKHIDSNKTDDSLFGVERVESPVSILLTSDTTTLDNALGKDDVFQKTETALEGFSNVNFRNLVSRSTDDFDIKDTDKEIEESLFFETLIQDEITIKAQLAALEEATALSASYDPKLDELDVNEMVDLIDKQTHLSTPAEDVPEVSLQEVAEDFDEALFIEETILDVVTQGGGSIQRVEAVMSSDLTAIDMDEIESESEIFSSEEVSITEVSAHNQMDISLEEVLFVEEAPVQHLSQ